MNDDELGSVVVLSWCIVMVGVYEFIMMVLVSDGRLVGLILWLCCVMLRCVSCCCRMFIVILLSMLVIGYMIVLLV